MIDYRERDAISKNQQWASLHNNFKASEWYGVCWFDMLPGEGSEKVKYLSTLQYDTLRVVKFVSDYCDNADHRTIDLFDGKPLKDY